jgi:hypothetical protein
MYHPVNLEEDVTYIERSEIKIAIPQRKKQSPEFPTLDSNSYKRCFYDKKYVFRDLWITL